MNTEDVCSYLQYPYNYNIENKFQHISVRDISYVLVPTRCCYLHVFSFLSFVDGDGKSVSHLEVIAFYLTEIYILNTWIVCKFMSLCYETHDDMNLVLVWCSPLTSWFVALLTVLQANSFRPD